MNVCNRFSKIYRISYGNVETTLTEDLVHNADNKRKTRDQNNYGNEGECCRCRYLTVEMTPCRRPDGTSSQSQPFEKTSRCPPASLQFLVVVAIVHTLLCHLGRIRCPTLGNLL
ncbi:hypothetical protein PPYR_13122 [Photinus pyralis]|uniref:Uncharacterized protein n=1 Tax=Photinus pyralis TaxID=7054 RepID=A0A5N4A864_PHOPY|nr:hypothetical protein PPYR_13122 [Photinus pyralis]